MDRTGLCAGGKCTLAAKRSERRYSTQHHNSSNSARNIGL
jgi:hypothetical protein